MTEGHAVPLGVTVAGANRHDMQLAGATLASLVVPRSEPSPERPQDLCLDKSYDYREVRDIVAEFGFTAPIRSRGEEAQALRREADYRARRWVVERTHSRMNGFRRLLVR